MKAYFQGWYDIKKTEQTRILPGEGVITLPAL